VDSSPSHHRPLPARRVRRVLIGVVAATAALSGPSIAAACSQDSATYFESFLDTTCLQAPLTNTSLDALGVCGSTPTGRSRASCGTPTSTSGGGRLGLSARRRQHARDHRGRRAGDPDAPTTPLPLTPDPASPVLGPTTSLVLDGDNVGGPAVIKVGATYVMYYTGSAEAGGPTVILRATSTDGKAWTRVATPNTAVLTPSAGAFDEKGVGSPDVRYDPADATTPYRMWYSGAARCSGRSAMRPPPTDHLDEVHGHPEPGRPAGAGPGPRHRWLWRQLQRGRPVGHQGRRRLQDVVHGRRLQPQTHQLRDLRRRDRLQKGGTVLGPESSFVTANFSEGAYAPVVWKTGTTFNMLFSGRKFVSGTTYQTKIQSSSSSDGINWGSVGVGLNPAGSASNFDNSNLEAPTILDEGAAGLSGTSSTTPVTRSTRTATATTGSASLPPRTDPASASSLDPRPGPRCLTSARSARRSTPAGRPAWRRRRRPHRCEHLCRLLLRHPRDGLPPRIGEATSSDAATWTKVTGCRRPAARSSTSATRVGRQQGRARAVASA